jgi:hypothetical protein
MLVRRRALSSFQFVLPATVHVGLAVSGRRASRPGQAQFAEFKIEAK